MGKKYPLVLLVLLLSLLVGGGLTLKGFFLGADRVVRDVYHVVYSDLFGKRYGADDIVIASIDAESLRAMSEDPQLAWGRFYGKALRKSREYGARLVVFDVHLFATPRALGKYVDELPEGLSAIDREFIENLYKAGDVVLASKVIREGGVEYDMMPALDYRLRQPGGEDSVGVSILVPDKDGVVRDFVYALPRSGEDAAFSWSLAVQAASLLGVPVKQTFDSGAGGEALGSILYVGPPGSFQRVSFADLLADDAAGSSALAARLNDKVVLVGFDCDALGDKHMTPYSGSVYPEMSGVEIHANIIATLLKGNGLAKAPFWMVALLWVLVIFLAIVVHFRYKFLKKIGLFDVVWIAAMAAVGFLFFCRGYTFDQGGFFVSLTLFFALYNIFDSKVLHEIHSGRGAEIVGAYLLVVVAVGAMLVRFFWTK